jgi:hypothetical protein
MARSREALRHRLRTLNRLRRWEAERTSCSLAGADPPWSWSWVPPEPPSQWELWEY